MPEKILHSSYYLWSVALVFPLWLTVFLIKKNSRREMIYTGLAFGAAALLLDRYCSIYDYWRPTFIWGRLNFESFFYGFFMSGLAAKAFELVTGREYLPSRPPSNMGFALITVISMVLWVVFLLLLGLNSIYGLLSIMGLWAVVFWIREKRLLVMSLISGLVMGIFSVAYYGIILWIYPKAIKAIWLKRHISGWEWWGVPIEEHAYLFLLGVVGSMTYKILTDARPEDEVKDRIRAGRLRMYGAPLIVLALIVGYIAILGEKGRFVIPRVY